MTTARDDLQKRIANRGDGPELTTGVYEPDGFADASGEYPKQNYFFGSSINTAARGATVNELFTGGGDIGVSIDLPDQKPSVYPLNSVQETQSGHIIEIDDTPGGERILIKHRSGSGIELRADGSTLYSSPRNQVEIVGADHTVIVEGNGQLVYRGNLDVHVTGDYNLSVGGNINISGKNNVREVIHGSKSTEILNDYKEVIKGQAETVIVEKDVRRSYGTSEHHHHNHYQLNSMGNIDMHSSGTFKQSGALEWAATGQVTNINGDQVSVTGITGKIGGDFVEYWGSHYTGIPGLCTFTGQLQGTAAIALVAGASNISLNSLHALQAIKLGALPAPTLIPIVPIIPTVPIIPPPVTPVEIGLCHMSDYAIKNIDLDVDHNYLNDLIHLDDYKGLLDHEPDIHEIRAKLRTYKTTNADFANKLVQKRKLHGNYHISVPAGNIERGRTSTNEPTSRFGYTPLGNNALENRSQRFIPRKRT